MLGWRFISGALRALLAGYDRAEDCLALRRNLEVSCYQFRGKTAVIVPSKDQLVSTLDPLIEGVKAGELDEHLPRQPNSEEAFDARPLGCGNIRPIVRFLASAFERTADVRSEVR